MSGHNKWSTIKHRKGAQDAKRGKIFTKLIKEITISAKNGGGDPNSNPRLRTAITAAKNENMPKENIERAIKKGSGELDGVTFEEITYEGYGPGGTAILVEAVTDNKNRAVAEIRHIFNKHGGNLGENGCVNWMFDKKGLINVEISKIDENSLMEIAIEAGAEDIKTEKNFFSIITPSYNLSQVRNSMEKASIPYTTAEITMIARNKNTTETENKDRLIKMLASLEDCDDVQKVYTNANIKDI